MTHGQADNRRQDAKADSSQSSRDQGVGTTLTALFGFMAYVVDVLCRRGPLNIEALSDQRPVIGTSGWPGRPGG
jgi:hypothetical protein